MLAKRIIPCLDVKEGRTVKGVNFVNLQDAGDPVSLAKAYSDVGADELVLLDISATLEGRGTMVELAERVAREISIPFTIGGGISTVNDMAALFRVGADKISLNSAAVYNPRLVSEGAARFGCQAIVGAVDVKKRPGGYRVMTHGGKQDSGILVLDWVQQLQELGVGEILLTSMDCDGVKEGFDLDLLGEVKKVAKVPVIASGGAGKKEDFYEVFSRDLAEGALAASVFHFGAIDIRDLKEYLRQRGTEIRLEGSSE